MRILLIDDDVMILRSLERFLTLQLQHEVDSYSNVKEALEKYNKVAHPIVLSDIRMPGMDGYKLIETIKSTPDGANTDIILMTGFPDVNSTVRALRLGAYDYLKKPVSIDELETIINRSIEHQKLINENRELKKQNQNLQQSISKQTNVPNELFKKIANQYAIGIFSPTMQQIIEDTLKYHTDRSIPVLIEGETGTGKENIARIIHYAVGSNTLPFISINCSSISETLFESELFGYEKGSFTGADSKGRIGKMELANGGTLFLDEIGDMPLSIQPKLLRALQEKEIYRVGGNKRVSLDLRIICATNKKLQDEVMAGNFRADLYYRVNTACIQLPPLRERKEEILPLAQYFINQIALDKKQKQRYLSQEAEHLLYNYQWPGNVRQLKNVMERVLFLTDNVIIHAEELCFLYEGKETIPLAISRYLHIEIPEDKLDLYKLQEKIVTQIYHYLDSNKVRTASFLGISINKLRRILKEM